MSYNLRGKIARSHPYSLDKTLSKEGTAAESKSVGDAFARVNADLKEHVDSKDNPHNVTKAQVGLGSVDNTADLDKPVSKLQELAIADAKKAGTDAQTAAEAAQNTANTKTKKTETVATLAVSGWKDLGQTVAVPGVTETNTVLVVSAPGNYVAYADSNVRCTGQGNGTLTFACDETPLVELTANVLILD